ncbi:MAG: hypothetical protein RIT25_731 [Planctomycetota bacterium]
MSAVRSALRIGMRHHLRHRLQGLLTLLGIALGCALWTGLRLSLGSTEAAFERAVETVAGPATHTVQAGPAGLDESTVARLRAVHGIRACAPSVGGVARVQQEGRRRIVRVFGTDPLAERGLRPWLAGASELPLGAWLTTPGAFMATASTLGRLGVGDGESLELQVGGRRVRARCIGVLGSSADRSVRAGLEDVLLTDIATAQEWFGREGRVDRIDLRLEDAWLPPGTSAAAALAIVQQAVGAAVRIEPAGASAGMLSRLTAAFRANLQALSLLSLLVGGFLVHETMRLSVLARRREFGVLRALGAGPHALALGVMGEGIAFGAVGGLLGAALGLAFGSLMLQPLVGVMNDHYATFALEHVEADPWVLACGVLLGIATAAIAALLPAREAGAVAPRDALLASPWRARQAAVGRRMFPIGCALLVPAALLLATAGTSLARAYAGMFSGLVAAALAVPAVLDLLLRATAVLASRIGPLARLVVGSARASLPRTGLPVAALALALATAAGLGAMIGSFRGSVAGWLHHALPADVYVGVQGGVEERVRDTIDPVLVRALQGAVPDATVSAYRRLRLQASFGAGRGELEVVAFEPSPRIAASFVFLEGEAGEARAAMAAGRAAWISEPLAFRRSLRVGDRIELWTDRGAVSLPVAAVFRDYGTEQGVAMVPASFLGQHMDAMGVTSLAVEAPEGVAAEDLAERLRVALAQQAVEQDLVVVTEASLRESSLQVFDRTFAVTGALRILCLLVAFCGIYGSLAALQLERGSEVGLLRTLGATPRRVIGLVLGQTALLGALAGLLALPLGLALAQVLVHVVNRGSFGWTLTESSLPHLPVAEILVLAVVAALLAGLHPAVRFGRVRPVEVLRES